ncbi:MAG: hypothetical protein FWD21_03260 [Peptococcaceae bacterium]|nr:hypothetical protein [Peptococcaceae bacterium]
MPKKKKLPDYTDIQNLHEIVNLVTVERRSIAYNLCREIRFVYLTLERLRKEIENGDVVSIFRQGEQEFLRENPALKSYTNLIPKYSSLYKQVNDLLPAANPHDKESELQTFLKQG